MFAPGSVEEVQHRYNSLGPAAQGVVREVARAMSFDTDEYNDRVTDDVIETAREALFASLLEVQVGTLEEFESWQSTDDREVVELGNKNVENAAWHAPAFSDTVVMATFQNEREAAVDTLRRQAFGRLYVDLVQDSPGEIES